MTQETLVSEKETDVVVTRARTLATDVVELTLTPVDDTLPTWTPGAHIDLLLGEDLVRQYSLCGSVADPSSYKVAVLLTPDTRGGSKAVHGLNEGQTLRIRGPRNHFPLVASAHYIFVAGGIGITPMLPMIEEAEAKGVDWHLYYGGRTLGSMAYRDLLAAYGDKVTFVPQDTDGILDLASILGSPRANTLVYTCGPEPLLAAVEDNCQSWGPQALHLERFAAKPRESEGEDTEFEIVLQRSGTTITVGAEETAFDAMRAAGVQVLGSCLEGICGTCEQIVLEGEVDHRDSVLDEDEQEANDCMMVCVSRAKSARLVLDA
ncbi:MAG TPA: PDR/VanB family oxidoreductase [Marmoricola sp.]|nr:PDR/VanB family oxidoreductase [Marmoricola sp.]